MCEAPVALVTFLERERQWFKAALGTDLCETRVEDSFCVQAIREPGLLVVRDAQADLRFSDLPVVRGEPHIRFYAGAPLVTPEGVAVGTICVLDVKPRPDGLTAAQEEALQALSRQVMTQLALTRRTRDLARSERRFRALADAMPQMVWSTLPDGFHDYYNDRWYEFTGVPHGSTDGEGWNGMFHPDDQARAWTRWSHSLKTGEPYEIEYRLRHRSGQYRWTLGRALPVRNDAGEIERWFGTCTDIDDIKANEESRELLTRELSHRIQNIFAVVNSLVALSARGQTDVRAYARALRERLDALSAAHSYIRPQNTPQADAAAHPQTMRGLFGLLLSAYRDGAEERILFLGDDLPVGERAATALALIIHEQATNATKYGALSQPEGRVELSGRRDADGFEIVWRERGGPRIAGPPERQGFGALLAQRSATGVLGGTIAYAWEPDGLVVTLRAPAVSFAR
jgi:PAS domain S-box-containing protein